MPLILYAHPFSSYCQKALIAFYENDVPFELRMLSPEHEANQAAFAELWPIKRFPLLVEGDRPVPEATVIIEYLQVHYPGPVSLIPASPDVALEVRFLDRFFDNYVSAPQMRIVFDALRAPGDRDPYGVTLARQQLDIAYQWLEDNLGKGPWAMGDAFTLADCAAAPSLFYADWTHPMDGRFPRVAAYRRRLLARPAFAHAVEEARPYRPLFPLGAPDRD